MYIPAWPLHFITSVIAFFVAIFRKIVECWSSEVIVNGIRKSKRYDTKRRQKFGGASRIRIRANG